MTTRPALTRPTASAARGLDRLAHRETNGLGLVRLLLALLVIAGHAPVLTGDPALSAWEWAAGYAVDGFFVASGFLITASRLRTSFPVFLRHRVLRIFPGYWAAVWVTVLVLAPASALAEGSAYPWREGLRFGLDHVWLRGHSWSIPGTLTSLPQPGLWLGQCWTLAAEFACYLVVGVALSTAWTRARAAWVLPAMLAASWAGWVWVLEAGVSSSTVVHGMRLLTFFLTGASLYPLRHQVRLAPWAVLLASVAMLAAGLTGLSETLWPPLVAASVLGWALYLSPRVGSRRDLSYGVYVYGMPLQQLLLAAGATSWPLPLTLVACVSASLAMAWLSWTLVEAPALRRKSTPLLPRPRRHAA